MRGRMCPTMIAVQAACPLMFPANVEPTTKLSITYVGSAVVYCSSQLRLESLERGPCSSYLCRCQLILGLQTTVVCQVVYEHRVSPSCNSRPRASGSTVHAANHSPSRFSRASPRRGVLVQGVASFPRSEARQFAHPPEQHTKK